MDDNIYDQLSSFSEVSKAQLNKIFASIPHNKDITIEAKLIKPLERICGVNWLKSQGVEKIFKLGTTTNCQSNTQFYLIYSDLCTFQRVVNHIQALVHLNKATPNVKHHVICIPKSLYVFDKLIEKLGLWDWIAVYSFQWFPIHLDTGVLSLELPHMFRDVCVHDDYTLLPALSKSLWHLFLSLGVPQYTLTLGQNSRAIIKQLETLSTSSQTKGDISGALIIDRNIDYLSALLTPSIYSGLLNEVYGVTSGVCKEDKQEMVEKLDEQFNPVIHKQAVNFALDSKRDLVYKLIRDKNFIHVTEILRNLTKDLKIEGATSDMALHEMKRYVQTKLQSVAQKKQLVANHLNAAETIVRLLHSRLQKLTEIEASILQNQSKSRNLASIDEYLQTEHDLSSTLAVFLLLCVTQKLTDSETKSFLNRFFAEFGYSHAHLYQKLIKANLIESVNSSKLKLPLLNKSTFFTNASKLKQVINEPDRIDLKNPTCCSYVYGGLYIPVVAQVASLVLSGTPLDDLKQKLQHIGEVNLTGRYQTYQSGPKCLLLYIVGGITYSEIAALNLLESMMGVRIIKMSDRVISKHDIVAGFLAQ